MKRLTTVADAAEQLGLARSTLYALIRQGRLPAHRFGDRVLVDVEQLLAATLVAIEGQPEKSVVGR